MKPSLVKQNTKSRGLQGSINKKKYSAKLKKREILLNYKNNNKKLWK